MQACVYSYVDVRSEGLGSDEREVYRAPPPAGDVFCSTSPPLVVSKHIVGRERRRFMPSVRSAPPRLFLCRGKCPCFYLSLSPSPETTCTPATPHERQTRPIVYERGWTRTVEREEVISSVTSCGSPGPRTGRRRRPAAWHSGPALDVRNAMRAASVCISACVVQYSSRAHAVA